MGRGYASSGDVIRSTIDGVDVNTLFAEAAALTELRNADRDSIVPLLTHNVTVPAEEVVQSADPDDFEDSSEYGVPMGLRPDLTVLKLGYNLKDRDSRIALTYQFLREASSEQVRRMIENAQESDNKQLFRSVLGRLFNNVTKTNPEGHSVYPLYNADGVVPPSFGGNTFVGTHTHYLINNAAAVTAADVVNGLNHIRHHGYGTEAGSRLVILCNPAEGDVIRGFRVASGAKYDFIPAEGSPTFLTTQTVVGPVPPARFGRLPLIGGFGPSWVAESYLIPAGYLLFVSSHGSNDGRNPVGFREHSRPDYRGLQYIPGSNSDYPLQDSYYIRTWGTGVRMRGAAVAMKIAVGASYVVPTEYATVVA